MPLPNTEASLAADLEALGVTRGTTLMVHTSLKAVGWTVGGPATVIRALIRVLGDDGTLVMPAETPGLLDPAAWHDPRVKDEWHAAIREHLPVFDPLTTPTTMGAVAEAFRTGPGTRRSDHPLVSVCAHGRLASEITREHSLAFGEGRGTPFEKLYAFDGRTLLLGVGFERCTSLHYAESLVPNRRTTTHRYPMRVDGVRRWVEQEDMANDDGEHFPEVGARFVATGAVACGRVGEARAMHFGTRALVDFARSYFETGLPA